MMGDDMDVEMLIEEIQKRPAMFDKRLRDYSNATLRKQLWEEVCEVLIPSWTDLTSPEKYRRCLELQKKWHNLRTCFTRELQKQKCIKPVKSFKKRRKYIYFDKLLFLHPTIGVKSNIKSNSDDQVMQTNLSSSKEEPTEQLSPQVYETVKRRSSSANVLLRSSTSSASEKINESILDSIDEDVNFALSLVPFLRSLQDYQKIDAKIHIMSVLKNVKWPENNDL